MKKAFILLSTVLILTFIISSVPADAAGTITGVKLTELGILSWDEIEGADIYWLEIDIWSTPVEQFDDVRSRVTDPGDYRFELSAYADGGETLLASFAFYVRYDGSKFSVIEQAETTTSVFRTETTEVKTTVSLPDVKISDVSLTPDGILTWSTGEYSAVFMLEVDHHYIPAESGCSLKSRISEAGEYYIEIEAYVPSDMSMFDKFIFSVRFDGSVFSITGGMTGITMPGNTTDRTSDTSTDPAAPSGTKIVSTEVASPQSDTSSAPTALIVIAIAAGALIIGVVVFAIMTKSKK